MITNQIKVKSDDFWEDQLIKMQLGILVSHSRSPLSLGLESDISNLPFDKVYYVAENGNKAYVFSKDILDQAYDEARKYLHRLGYKQVMKGDK
jgi:hypothetical protein